MDSNARRNLRVVAKLVDYVFGRVTVNGSQETRDLIALPERVVSDWWRPDGHSLALEHLDEVFGEVPERLILSVRATAAASGSDRDRRARAARDRGRVPAHPRRGPPPRSA